MSNYIYQPQFSIAITILAILVFFILLYLMWRKLMNNNRRDDLNELYKKISEEIKFAVAPKSIQLSLDANNLVDLAVEVWRIEQRIAKSALNLPENQLKGLENSVQKLRRYLEKYDIEIIDYKNTRYNDGLNLDVLSVEKDSTLRESMIKETVEPTVMFKGQVVRKAKIIVLSNR